MPLDLYPLRELRFALEAYLDRAMRAFLWREFEVFLFNEFEYGTNLPLK